MITLRYLQHRLEPYALNDTHVDDAYACPEHIEVLEDQSILRVDRTYLGTKESASLLANIPAEPGCVILLAGDGTDPTPKALPQGCVVLAFSCSLTQLLNTVSRASATMHEYRNAFQALSEERKGTQAIIELASNLAHHAAFLFDYNNRIVSTDGVGAKDYLAGLVSKAGSLPQDIYENLFDSDPLHMHGLLSIPEKNVTLYAQKLLYHEQVASVLVLEVTDDQSEIDYFALCSYAMDCVRSHLLFSGLSLFGTKGQNFQQCWSTIMKGKLVGNEDIREALSHMPCAISTFFQTGIVVFPAHKEIPYYYVMARLREIFPKTNIAVYNGDIALLFSFDTRSFHRDILMQDELEELLETFDAYMAISNGTRDLTALKRLYGLSRQTALLARQLQNKPGKRFVDYEDYSMYSVIDLCAQQFKALYDSDDIIYLIHPSVILLSRYDAKHKSNLRDVLYYYLLNDRNLVKTAACTYMHRNTVLNKLKKINELIDLDLEDGQLRQRLTFSCQLILYYERVMHLELKLEIPHQSTK